MEPEREIAVLVLCSGEFGYIEVKPCKDGPPPLVSKSGGSYVFVPTIHKIRKKMFAFIASIFSKQISITYDTITPSYKEFYYSEETKTKPEYIETQKKNTQVCQEIQNISSITYCNHYSMLSTELQTDKKYDIIIDASCYASIISIENIDKLLSLLKSNGYFAVEDGSLTIIERYHILFESEYRESVNYFHTKFDLMKQNGKKIYKKI